MHAFAPELFIHRPIPCSCGDRILYSSTPTASLTFPFLTAQTIVLPSMFEFSSGTFDFSSVTYLQECDMSKSKFQKHQQPLTTLQSMINAVVRSPAFPESCSDVKFMFAAHRDWKSTPRGQPQRPKNDWTHACRATSFYSCYNREFPSST
jgi:hypothetical protein